MFRLVAWLGLVLLLAVSQRGTVRAWCEAEAAPSLSQAPGAPGEPMLLDEAGPVEVADDGDDLDGDTDALDVGAVTALQLAPGTPCFALAMPSGARVAVLWSRAIQECGPPGALSA